MRVLLRSIVALGVFATSAVACGGATKSGAESGDASVPDEAAARDASADVFAHGMPDHRPIAIACSRERGPGRVSVDPFGHYDAGTTCNHDTDCTAGINGRCNGRAGPAGYQSCSYDECFVDADCGPNGVCVCGVSGDDLDGGVSRGGNNICARGNCVVDSDCGPGGVCSPVMAHKSVCGDHIGGFYCHTPADTCGDFRDCKVNEDCVYDPTRGHFACVVADYCTG
jgi:hypothetical protein